MKKDFFCRECEKVTKHKVTNNRRKCLECKKEQKGLMFGGFFLANG